MSNAALLQTPGAPPERAPQKRAIRIGILGCGAITRIRHIGSVCANPDVRLMALVDEHVERAEALRKSYGLDCDTAADWRGVMSQVDAVINALPNQLHAPVNCELLRAGIHVLSEKPLATSSADARACSAAAEATGAVLAVGMPWRFQPAMILMRMVLGEGMLGSVKSYDWDYGMPLDWPTASAYFLSNKKAGGGVLIEEGVHLLDSLLYWFGPVKGVHYQDDNWGSGLEANCILTLEHDGPLGRVKGRVRLSRTYALKNRLRVEGTHTTAELRRSDVSAVYVTQRVAGRELPAALRLPEGQAVDAFQAELRDFVAAIRNCGKPAVGADHAAQTLALIERCYAQAEHIQEPWLDARTPPADRPAQWSGKRILVTGATGFIGGRVAERLVAAGVSQVRALVHNPSHASRVARLPIELCQGDLLDRDSVRRALRDTAAVIHLGLGFGPGIARGTKILLEEAEAAQIARFVHISSTAVHGLTPPPGADSEAQPLLRTGNVYCDAKVDAERLAHKFSRRGLPVVILRPALVWGPYSRWCTRQIEGLRQGSACLIDGGQGICNTTYVDNLVDAIFLALHHPQAVGEAFFITDDEGLSWADFIFAHSALMSPEPRLKEVSSLQAWNYYQSLPNRWSASAKALVRLLVGGEGRNTLKQVPIIADFYQWLWYRWQSLDRHTQDRIRTRLGADGLPARAGASASPFPEPETLAMQTCATRFSIAKARRVLGYVPRIGFGKGMHLTKEWLHFANYL